jgi:hypothetical protein
MSRTAIVVEKVLPYPAEKIWHMLNGERTDLEMADAE